MRAWSAFDSRSGTEVRGKGKRYSISQRKSVLDLLKESGMLGWSKSQDWTNHKVENVGKLFYLSHTRPEIAYAVSLVSQFMHAPRSWSSAKKQFLEDRFFFLSHQSKQLAKQANNICLWVKDENKLWHLKMLFNTALDPISFVIVYSTHACRGTLIPASKVSWGEESSWNRRAPWLDQNEAYVGLVVDDSSCQRSLLKKKSPMIVEKSAKVHFYALKMVKN